MIVALRFTILALILSVTQASIAQTASSPSNPSAAIIAKINARGTGKGIKVTETSGQEIKGTLVSLDADGFSVIAKGAATPVHIAYTDVAKIGNPGMSLAGKLGTGVLIGVVAFAVLIIIIVALAAR